MSEIPPITKQKALLNLRVIWAALLLSPLIFFAVMMFIIRPSSAMNIAPELLRVLHFVSLGMVIVLIPAGYVLRLQVYKKHWVGNAVIPTGYLTGNLLLLAICEGTALFGIVVTFLAGIIVPFIIPAFIAVLTQAINWPNGKPMEPAEPELMRR